MAACAGHSFEWFLPLVSALGTSLKSQAQGQPKWGSVVWVGRSLAGSLQSKWGWYWDSRMWRNSIPTGTSPEFVQRGGKLHWELCFCPGQCLETFSNELVFLYVLLWIYSIIARKISNKTVFEVDQSFIVFVKQLSCCNRKWPEQTAKACISLKGMSPSLPGLQFCPSFYFVCQEYLSSLWAVWPGHLVQCVCLPPWSLPIINLITFQDLPGEGVKWNFPESNWVAAVGNYDAVWHLSNKVLCFNFDVLLV